MKKEFIASFQLSRKIIFSVNFYTLMDNPYSHFSTSAYEFNQNKTGYRRAGQGQEDLTKSFLVARRFWKKWDKKHLQDLTDDEFFELKKDIEILKETYNYMYEELDETKRPYNPHFSFSDVKRLSMMKLSNSRNKAKRLDI